MLVNRKKTIKRQDYLKEESGTIIKHRVKGASIALAYPNTYFLGMSNLGFQSIYTLFNQDEDTVCERCFLPDTLVLGEVAPDRPLRSIESGRPIHDFDCLAFSISFENDYLNLLNILDLSEIPLYAKDRGENDPIVIAGGAAITINPEPIRPFIDALFIGEAEEAIAEISEVLATGLSREQKLDKLGDIEGIYLCLNIQDESNPKIDSIVRESHRPNSLEQRVSLSHLRQYKRRVPQDINGFPIQTTIYTPYSEFGKLSLIEVQRGCGRGCKFCAEGFIYTPFRQRSFDLIKEQVLEGLKHRNKIGLIGADLLVYPEINELFEFIHKSGGTFSPSSVRVDGMTPEIIKHLAASGHRTLAIAPEAGSEELRMRTNKKFNNQSILNVVRDLIDSGIPNIKLYLMIGLPFESDKDIDDMITLVKDILAVFKVMAKKHKRIGSLVMSINPFIPKPRTPYQVGYFEGIKPLEAKLKHIKKQLLPLGGIRIFYENPFFAYTQALLSNGTTHTSDYLMTVFKNQGSLKKSLRGFEH